MSAINHTYDKIYQKAADMVSLEETSMLRIVKHQTMRSNVSAESPKNYFLRNLYYPFLDSVILQLDEQFSGHSKPVMRLSSLLQANVVSANFCKVEPAVNLFLPLQQAPLIKVKAQFLLWQRFCQNHSDVVVWKKGLQTLPTAYFSSNQSTTQYSRNIFSIFCNCQTIFFWATTDKIRFTNNYGSN